MVKPATEIISAGFFIFCEEEFEAFWTATVGRS